MVVRLLAAGVVCVLTACSPSIAPPSSSSSQASAESPAAGLRVQLDLLLGEHAFAIAKLSVAAAAGRTDEFRSYAGMLAQNEADLTALMRTALGETAGAQFGDAWAEQNDRLVDYIVAASTQDQAGAITALNALTATYVPLMTALIASSLGMSRDTAGSLVTEYAFALKAVIDDAAAAEFPKLYADVAAAHTQAGTLGDVLSMHVVAQFPDRYPGDAGAPAVDRRAHLNAAVQRQAYTMTMATNAAVTGSSDELAAASAALARNVTALPPPAVVWTDLATMIVAYAKTGDPALRQSILNRAETPLNLKDQLTATLQVVDDQRAKVYDRLATDDRAAAASFATAADKASLSPQTNPKSSA